MRQKSHKQWLINSNARTLPGDGVPQTNIWLIFIQQILTFFAWLLVHLQTAIIYHTFCIQNAKSSSTLPKIFIDETTK